MREALPGRGGGGRRGGFYFYTTFYATQALHYRGGKDWEIWYKNLRDALRKTQAKNGSWQGSSYGNAFQTAFMSFCLQVPKEMLPILER